MRRTFNTTHQRCYRCREWKTFDCFHKGTGPSGRRKICKPCRAAVSSTERRKYVAKTKITSAKWRNENRERFREMQRAWRMANPEKQKSLEQLWEKANPDRRRSHTRNYRSRKRSARGTHTHYDIEFLKTKQKNRCAICKADISATFEVDHITPLVAGGSNSRENLQLTCASCNRSKNDKHPIDFMQSRGYLL